ncbi:MAG: glutathione S-transferase family protein, partial [Alphaproteobacteria bacterium]|nr:glutathione S-transferase family protein [Alphaproteobacteria bacterium]
MLKILGRKNSSNVQKVIWACEEMSLTFAQEDIGGPFGRNKDPEYLALNPNGTVPTIVENGFSMWESNAIIRHLASRHGVGTLWPKDANDRAHADQWMDWQQTVVNAGMLPLFLQLIRVKPEERDANLIKTARDKAAAAFAILDKHVAKNSYVAGANFTMGDIPLGIAVYRWYTLPIERENYPALKGWYDR